MTINAIPTHWVLPKCSPKKTTAKTTAMGRLILSMDATRDALPICRARKYKSQESPVVIPEKNKNSKLL